MKRNGSAEESEMSEMDKQDSVSSMDPAACASCGSYQAETDGLCLGCAHAVEAHGALRSSAYAVECDCAEAGR